MGRYDLQDAHKLATGCPSDTLCCLVPEIYVTLAAAVVDPLRVVSNDSANILVPKKYSAYCLAAIVDLRLSRYYAFLTLRSAILLRRRSHWFPRAINALRMPDLTPRLRKRFMTSPSRQPSQPA